MRHFSVEPEVSGGLGERTVMDRSTHPPLISHLHFQFDGWLGDALVESFPVFLVTEHARSALIQGNVTGVEFRSAEVTTSEAFANLYADATLPKFVWLEPVGRAGLDDVGLAKDNRLVLSQKAVDLLGSLGLKNALIRPYDHVAAAG